MSLQQKIAGYVPAVKEALLQVTTDRLLTMLEGHLSMRKYLSSEDIVCSMMVPATSGGMPDPTNIFGPNLERLDITVSDAIELLQWKNKEQQAARSAGSSIPMHMDSVEMARRIVAMGGGDLYKPYQGHAPRKNALSRKVKI